MTRDAWIGVGMLALAVLYWIGADGIRISPLDGPVGAAGLPKTLAYALGLLAVLLIVRSFVLERAGSKRPVSAGDGGGMPEAEEGDHAHPHLRAAGMLVIGVFYLLIVPYLGYAISIMSLMLAVALYIGARPNRKTIVFAVLGGILFYFLFVRFLGIPLPPGLWPSFF